MQSVTSLKTHCNRGLHFGICEACRSFARLDHSIELDTGPGHSLRWCELFVYASILTYSGVRLLDLTDWSVFSVETGEIGCESCMGDKAWELHERVLSGT